MILPQTSRKSVQSPEWSREKTAEGRGAHAGRGQDKRTAHLRSGRFAAAGGEQEQFRAVFEEGPIGLALVSPDGRLLRVNRRFCEMLGYSEREIVALGLERITHPDDWKRDYPFLSRLWRGEIMQYRTEKRYLRKDGRALRAQLTVSLLHDAAGKPVNNLGMIEDITERKRAEEKLRNSEGAMRTLMDASPETILLLDAEGNHPLRECDGRAPPRGKRRRRRWPHQLRPASAGNRRRANRAHARGGSHGPAGSIRRRAARPQLRNRHASRRRRARENRRRRRPQHRPHGEEAGRAEVAAGPRRAGAAGRGPHERTLPGESTAPQGDRRTPNRRRRRSTGSIKFSSTCCRQATTNDR